MNTIVNIPQKTVLITGGAGFIGSAVCKRFLKDKDYSVVVVDKMTYAADVGALNELRKNKRFSFVKADICDRKAMQNCFARHRPNIVMHLAAESHVDNSISSPSVFLETNIIGTFILLETSRQYVESLQQNENFIFHHVSTDEVYGDLSEHEAPFEESTPYAPSSPYSASKASSDHLVRAWQRTYGLPVVVSNCSNNYGPRQYPEKLIPVVISKALDGADIPIYGDGLCIRDWLHVEDHANALFEIATKGSSGNTYNVGSDNELTNLQLVNMICKLLDEKCEIKPNKIDSFSDLITFVKDRPGHDKRYAINASKLKRELGWESKIQFAEGLSDTVDWYLNNLQNSRKLSANIGNL
jgi:dTDP-glucose 4,6-dehydratase